jgi:hypothetical protein
MDTMKNFLNPQGELELDLWHGQVIDRSTETVISSIKGWSKQQSILANESFIATRAPGTGIHFLDLTLLWPDWLQNTTYLQDIRRRVDAPRARTSAELKPFGWTLRMIDKRRCGVVPNPASNGNSIPIRAARSFSALDRAEKALRSGDYEAVLRDAVSSLEICRESHQARMLIGVCCFRHGLEPPAENKAYTARKLLEYQEALQCAVNALSIAWGRERERNPRRWAFITEKIDQYEDLLKALADVFEKAKLFLRGV